MSDKPVRRFEVTIRISGDTWQDIVRTCEDVIPHLADHGPECSIVSGGYSNGHYVQVTEYPDMTHERYVEGLKRWMETRESRPSPDTKEKGNP